MSSRCSSPAVSQRVEFKGPLMGPPQTVVLYGDPTKPGPFISRVKFSAGWKDPNRRGLSFSKETLASLGDLAIAHRVLSANRAPNC